MVIGFFFFCFLFCSSLSMSASIARVGVGKFALGSLISFFFSLFSFVIPSQGCGAGAGAVIFYLPGAGARAGAKA